MKIEYQVCSQEQGRKLKSLGVNNDSFHEWKNGSLISENGAFQLINMSTSTVLGLQIYPAFTVSELLKLLPWMIEIEDVEKNTIAFHFLNIEFDGPGDNCVVLYSGLFLQRDKNPVTALSDILIRLLENDYVKPEDLKL